MTSPSKPSALFANFDSGVAWFNGEPIFYERSSTGAWQARIIGASDLLPITPDLIKAINADIAHQRSKQ